MRTLAVLVAVAVTLLAVAGVGAPANRTGAGLELRFDLEAAFGSTRQVSSDRAIRFIGQAAGMLAPWAGVFTSLLLSGPPTDVFEHSKSLSGTFLGEPVSGELKVVEVRRGQSEHHPALMRLEVRGSSLVLAFGAPADRGYRVWAVREQSTGVFSGVEAGGHVRVVGLAERFSIVRGEVVVGWQDHATAVSTMVAGGWSEEAARSAVSGTRLRVVPFPQADPKNPPARTEVRWVSSPAGTGAADVSLAVLLGTDAMPLAEGGTRARSARVRVVAAHSAGTGVLFDGEAGPGDQVLASGKVSLPAILMVVAGPRTLFQASLAHGD